MRLLADEGCDFVVVRTLRAAGHEVFAACEEQRQSLDADLMTKAHQEGRILLTEDKDFGWLAFVAHMQSPGVVLVRVPAGARQTFPYSILKLVDEHGDKLKGAFVVVSPGSIRISGSSSVG